MASPVFFYIISILFLQLVLIFGNVTLSSILSTNDNNSWLSLSGEFAFGFRQFNKNNTNFFMLAIWYNKISDKTIVWTAQNDNNLVQAPTGSQIQLTSSGLTLTTSQGDSLWTAQPNDIVSYGTMLDSGNFVLVKETSTSVWESFNFPTDTLLPKQSLDLSGSLTSRFSETNFSGGRFQLYFNGVEFLMSPLAWPTQFRYNFYYRIVVPSNFDSSSLVFDELGDIYVETNNINNGTRIKLQDTKWENLVLDSKLYYYRATLDYYGIFTQYSHPRDNNTKPQGWSIVRYVPDNICTAIFNDFGSGTCGYNSYCSIENQRPSCKCPYGYSLIDQSNQFGGCQINFTLGCEVDNGEGLNVIMVKLIEVYEFTVVKNVNWPLSDYERLQPYSQPDCQQSCLLDCMCAVAVFSGQTCWKKRLPLANGRVEKDGSIALVKTRVAPLGPSPSSNANDSKKDDGVKPILQGLLIGSTVINSILLAVVVFLTLLKLKRVVQGATLLETNLHSFSYEALKEATWGFREELGRGSFGIVYKGELKTEASCNVVAVKRLDRLIEDREKEFKTELRAIGKTCHKNLVRLIGFCDEGMHRMLVYEFMSNGTLADILFGQNKPIWNVRVGFALGIARGLVYLHEECDSSIIHCDIKPQNILIDDYFTAKISDFGLAKLLLADQSRTNTMIRGTRGYVAPEWFKNVPVTAKVDVYSFGAMLLEIICCRRSVVLMESGEEEKAILTDWACDCYMEGRIDTLVENDQEALDDIVRLEKWIKIAIWCIQEHPEMRPTMRMVIQMLEGVVEVPNPPSPFSFDSIP